MLRLGHGLDSMTSEFFPKLTDSVVLCSGLLRGRHVRDAILCGARRAAPVGGAVGRCGQGAGDPSLSPSTFYIPLRFLLSLLLPFALALRLGFSPCVPLLLLHLPSFPPAPRSRVALRSRRRDPNGLASRSSSLSPQSRMSSIQNLQSFGKSRRYPATPAAPLRKSTHRPQPHRPAPGPAALPLPSRGPRTPRPRGDIERCRRRRSSPCGSSGGLSLSCRPRDVLSVCGEETSGGRLSPSLLP